MRRLLLQQCTDEQRFQITAKLCEDVLGGVADGTLVLDQSQGILGEGLISAVLLTVVFSPALLAMHDRERAW